MIYLEDLRDMEVRGKGRTLNTRLSSSARGQIVAHTRHQAARYGIAVVIVPARGTSRYCPACLTAFRHRAAPDRTAPGWKWASCPNTACGYSADRDVAAWQRIGARGLQHQHLTVLDRASGPATGNVRTRRMVAYFIQVSSQTMVVSSTSGEYRVPVDSVNANGFAREGLDVLNRIAESARGEVRRAAELMARCVSTGGVVQAFGTGHSQALVLELAGRAGGLVPTNRLSIADLVLYGGDDPSVLDDPLLERKPGVAERIYDLVAPRPEDLFVIVSNSGVNNMIVEMALHAKDHGHRVLAITSLTHTRAVPASHPSGKKLADIADVVLDNAAPRGDALLELPGGGSVCALSTLTGVMLVQMAVAETASLLLTAGLRPPVYVSANVPGGFEGNLELEKRYAGRIRRTAS